MFVPRAAVLAVFVLGLPAGSSFAAEPPRADEAAAAARGSVVQVGPAVGDPEKDTFAFARDADASECTVVPRFGPDAARHGPATGDAEKDNLAFGISSYEERCNRAGGGNARDVAGVGATR